MRLTVVSRLIARLDGRVALVTGCTSGIGLGVSKALAAQGCQVMITGFGDQQKIQQIKNDFQRDYGLTPDYLEGDLTKPKEIENMIDSINKHYPSGVDILVNNAGFQHVSPVEEFSMDIWNSMLSVMLTAPFTFTKAFLPNMKNKGWGRIINISSVHGLKASPYKSCYVSCKHGLVGLTKVVALETADTPVTCNAICPGYVDTPILQSQVEALSKTENITYKEAQEKFLEKYQPSKNPVPVESIADLVVFLCSDAAKEMRGSAITIDGAMSIK